MLRTRVSLAGASALLLAASLAFAAPARNVNPAHHPHLAEAQKLSKEAFEQLLLAQKANEFDMNGHAQKAKDLLDQVNAEIKQAAEAANHH